MSAIVEASDESMSEYKHKESSVSIKLSFRESAVRKKESIILSTSSSKKKYSMYLKPGVHCSDCGTSLSMKSSSKSGSKHSA